jgi:hypothetical protein
MPRNKIEMNITEEKAYNLVCEKESLGSLEFELLQLYFSICVVITVTLLVLFLIEEIGNFKKYIFINIILYCLPYICKKIKIYTLRNDNEYQLAKQILKKYKEKVKKENLKIELEETFEKEQRKSDKIKEFKKYLNEENEK